MKPSNKTSHGAMLESNMHFRLRWISRRLLGAVALTVLASAGCSDRIITIECASVINTYNQGPGGPLIVEIVSVLPEDFEGPKLDANRLLLPKDGGITSDQWFKMRPTRENMRDDDKGTSHFLLPADRIICYTDEKQETLYGVRAGGLIRGMNFRQRGEEGKIRSPGIPARDIHSDKAVIYVFAKFMRSRDIQPIPPAMFCPIGSYPRDIGVYIDEKAIYRTTAPQLHIENVIKGPERLMSDKK